MDMRKLQFRMSVLIVPFAIALALFGIVQGAVAPNPAYISTIRGTQAVLYGNGLYKYDSLFFGAGFIAQDFMVLLVIVPLIVTSVFLIHSKRVAGHILNYAVMGFLLYIYASLTFSAAYNAAFFAYIALFNFSLFAVYIAHRAVAECLQAERFNVVHTDLPKKRLAAFLVLAGSVTIFVWSEPLVTAMITSASPSRLDHYTTKFTEAADIGIIAPLCFVAAYLVLKSQLAGYVLAIPLLGAIILLLPAISAATVTQIIAGVEFTPPEIAGPIGGFLILGVLGFWLLVRMLRVFADARSAN